MSREDLAFILGIAAGIGITLLIEIVVAFIIWLLIRDKENRYDEPRS